MRSKDINLGVMFAILDSNSNNSLSFSEFRTKMYSLDMRLEEEEILALYKSLDKNGNQSITFDELIDKFCSLNNHQLLKRISSIIT
jgi:Ca2+-binding EF-hand superfamily protein